eukprot:c55769_g1_i1 orf=162-341(+)
MNYAYLHCTMYTALVHPSFSPIHTHSIASIHTHITSIHVLHQFRAQCINSQNRDFFSRE